MLAQERVERLGDGLGVAPRPEHGGERLPRRALELRPPRSPRTDPGGLDRRAGAREEAAAPAVEPGIVPGARAAGLASVRADDLALRLGARDPGGEVRGGLAVRARGRHGEAGAAEGPGRPAAGRRPD